MLPSASQALETVELPNPIDAVEVEGLAESVSP
jgi:hypothetical protein